jgi:MFS family permease
MGERSSFLSSPSMTTLADKMGDYRCSDEAATLSLAILFMYTSTIFAFLILTIFGDYLGRKNAIVIGLIATIGGLIITLVSPSLFMAAAGLFIALSGIQWAFSISFIFISETVAESHR